MTHQPIEPLEARRLLAGVTLITHGYNSDVSGWVSTAAADVAARIGGKSDASIYTMNVRKSGSKLAVTSFEPDSGQKDFTDTADGELIVKLDWSTLSTGSYTTQQVAAAVNNYFQVAHGDEPALAQLPMHLIGHSRGASLVTALSEDLGEAGIWVDQVTDLDPHPVDGHNDFLGADFGDQKMAVYSNVAFADNYWRTDGDANNADFDGESVKGTYNGDLNATVQKDFFISAHQAVTAYYVGTIDTKTLDGGDHPVIPGWYKGTKAAPARGDTGYVYSRLGGGERPLSGVSTLLGGRGSRVDVDTSGSQWANVLNFTTRGSRSITAGDTLDARFLVTDTDGRARVQVFADTDANPYDGGLTALSGRTFASGDLAAGRINVATGALSGGTYRLAARVTDGDGHTRWVYSPRSVGVTAAAPFATLKSGVLTVDGTAGNDIIAVKQIGTSTIVAELGAGERTMNFDYADVKSVVVMAGAGNDAVYGDLAEDELYLPMYVNGGPGKDTISGGLGSDTLSGGAQSDTLYGDLGDDVLNGNGGNNSLSGGGGYDRLYSADGSQDTMDGGSNADRFFGGSGNDSMIGGRGNDKMYGNGGNDTLIGGEGADILNGGSGTNTGDRDPLDLRTDIDVLITI